MFYEIRPGLFVNFEGIDGSGGDTQLTVLHQKIKKWDKYEHILDTHEPTRSHTKIKKKLESDQDPYSDAIEMAESYVEDRTEHTYTIIKPCIQSGIIVLCSRYKMSTCAYQQAQGIPLAKLLEMHERRGILKPDITFLLNVNGDAAEERREKRGAPREKFEFREFMDKAAQRYLELYELSLKNPNLFGRVVLIDGNPDPETVGNSIEKVFLPMYREWKGLDFPWFRLTTYGTKSGQ
ncbi:MAG: dTMP kinase [Candidatus Nanoarchaeia archaeon]|nr:dTMP kinase [Candidatus Nanoarchaeia archaeon]